jgi:hypothetical protein
MRKFSRKALVAGGLVATLALGGIAFAYFTTTGAGSATATVGTSEALVIHGSAADLLYPGTSSTVSFTVDNGSPGHQRVAKIHLVSVSTDVDHSACVVADFTMPDVNANQDFANGDGQAVTQTGTLSMANTAISQDACKDAPLTLHLSSN